MTRAATTTERSGATGALADVCFLTRPVLLGPVWVVYGAGALLGGAVPGWDLVFVSFAVAGVYVHNQLADVASDRANSKLFLLESGLVRRTAAWSLAALRWAASIAWAATQGPRLWLYLVALASGVLYNAGPPTPWKDRPTLGLTANILAHGVVTLMAGFTAAGGAFVEGALVSIPYAAAVGSVYLSTTIVDSIGDRASGKSTWAVRFGSRATACTILVLVVASVVGAAALDDWWMLAASVVGVPFAVLLARDPSRDRAERYAKFAVTALAAMVAARWHGLILIAALTFLASRVYYRRRFGIRYPSFGTDQA